MTLSPLRRRWTKRFRLRIGRGHHSYKLRKTAVKLSKGSALLHYILGESNTAGDLASLPSGSKNSCAIPYLVRVV